MGGMDSIGKPEQLGVMLGTLLAVWTDNRYAVNLVNAYWHRWTEMSPSECLIQVKAVPKKY